MALFTTIAAGTAAAKSAGVDFGDIGDAVSGFFGGKEESPADLSKQEIQDELERQGYPQFSKMSGWRGDEKAKEEAMKIIAATINNDPRSVQTIESWLDAGGNITPETIDRIKARYWSTQQSASTQESTETTPSPFVPSANTTAAATGTVSGTSFDSSWLILGGLVIAGIYLLRG